MQLHMERNFVKLKHKKKYLFYLHMFQEGLELNIWFHFVFVFLTALEAISVMETLRLIS